ncbi:MAG: hypothetical protein SW833_19520 [Cyanobacteriota bacterium]|nr:hypothetical protein [Cyanobacteriota bacterium]
MGHNEVPTTVFDPETGVFAVMLLGVGGSELDFKETPQDATVFRAPPG